MAIKLKTVQKLRRKMELLYSVAVIVLDSQDWISKNLWDDHGQLSVLEHCQPIISQSCENLRNSEQLPYHVA